MNIRSKIIITLTLIFILPSILAAQDNSAEIQLNSPSEKCSAEIEGLKVCAKSSKITVKSGEPVTINLVWKNLLPVERRIGRSYQGYSVTIVNEKDEKLVPVFLQRLIEREKRMEASGDYTMTEEDFKEMRRRITGGSDRGVDVGENQTTKDYVSLTSIGYDYDLTKKGEYKVTISRKVQGFGYYNANEFMIENIEIEVK